MIAISRLTMPALPWKMTPADTVGLFGQCVLPFVPEAAEPLKGIPQLAAVEGRSQDLVRAGLAEERSAQLSLDRVTDRAPGVDDRRSRPRRRSDGPAEMLPEPIVAARAPRCRIASALSGAMAQGGPRAWSEQAVAPRP
jgi:hypothetical protein